MNITSVQIDKNQHLVTHENGKISIVNSNTDKIEDILEKENEFEYLSNKRNKLRKKLKNTEFKNILADISMFGCMALISALFCLIMPITPAILTTALTYVPVKILHTGIFEIRVCRKRNKKRIEKEINELNAYLPTLRNEIAEIKKNTKFKKITMCSNENTTNNYSVTKISNYLYNFNDPQKEKVLKIGQKTLS